jgi:NAD(P)-dependent dehydrogenase (short-subunit alcohol dehydrogenase family)
MDLRDKVVIVTGASSGIGRATAREFARRGSHVALAARNETRLGDLAAELAGAPGHVLPVPTDVADEAAVGRLVDRTVAEFGGVDVLVNNAGYGLYAPIEKMPLAELRRQLDVNFFGAFHCVRAVLPHLRRRGGGRIAIVGSLSSHRSFPNLGAYAASKFALRALTDALRVELRTSGIKVTGVYPGLTISEWFDNTTRIGARPVVKIQRPVSAERVARAIYTATARGTREVYVLPSDRLILLGSALFPSLFDWFLYRFVHLDS